MEQVDEVAAFIDLDPILHETHSSKSAQGRDVPRANRRPHTRETRSMGLGDYRGGSSAAVAVSLICRPDLESEFRLRTSAADEQSGVSDKGAVRKAHPVPGNAVLLPPVYAPSQPIASVLDVLYRAVSDRVRRGVREDRMKVTGISEGKDSERQLVGMQDVRHRCRGRIHSVDATPRGSPAVRGPRSDLFVKLDGPRPAAVIDEPAEGESCD